MQISKVLRLTKLLLHHVVVGYAKERGIIEQKVNAENPENRYDGQILNYWAAHEKMDDFLTFKSKS